MTSKPFLPYGRQSVDESDVAAVAEVLRSDWLTTGPWIERFEEALAQRLQAPQSVVCNSGTAALHLATLTLGLGPGDGVIVPAVTFLATAAAVRHIGAEPVFADVDSNTALMRVSDAEAALDRGRSLGLNVRAIIPVHYAGQCSNPAEIFAWAKSNNLYVIDDAAHAVGTTYIDAGSKFAIGQGKHSDLTTFSFHPVKTITMGEGGAISTANFEWSERMRKIRNHGIERRPDRFIQRALGIDARGMANPWYYEMTEPGFNFRATDLQCALGHSQLQRLDAFIARRAQLVALYDTALEALSPLVQPLGRISNCQPSWHLYVVRIDFAAHGHSRFSLFNFLRERGIGSQVHYLPLHLQPYYQNRNLDLRLPGAEKFYDTALSLPLFPDMANADVSRVVDALAHWLTLL